MLASQRGERAGLAFLVVGSALLFLWDLGRSGYANSYYAAAAQAGAESWKAMLFGSLDPANAITVDKPPCALWPMDLSVRAFGLSSWSLLVPQAIEGAAAVALLHACVRRATGSGAAALLAGTGFALTPVAVAVFRFDNPDAMLTLLLVGAAYSTLRAVEDGHHARRWLVLAGCLCGLGFLTKMLEAFLVLPALILTYVLRGRAGTSRRLVDLLAAGGAVVASAGWWIALVELWPRGDRPFVGGSSSDSVIDLALGYNGLARITGSAGGPADGGIGASNLSRVSSSALGELGGQVLWLAPAVVVLGVLGWRLSLRHPRTSALRSSLLLWLTWLTVASTTFAFMAGVFHLYYTVVLAPAIAAVAATGSWLAWSRRERPPVRAVLALTVIATGALASGVLWSVGDQLRWTAVPILLAAVAATAVMHPRSGPGTVGGRTALAALAVALAGPVMFDTATVRLAHVGSGLLAGPGNGAPSTALVVGSPGRLAGIHLGAERPITPRLLSTLSRHAEAYRWAAAAVGARSAAAYQLALREPVLAIGGYKGTDPLPTLGQFEAMVGAAEVHWLVLGGVEGDSSRAIERWVAGRLTPTAVDGFQVYDLSPLQRSG